MSRRCFANRHVDDRRTPACSSSPPRCCRWRRSCCCSWLGGVRDCAARYRDDRLGASALPRSSAATQPASAAAYVATGGHRPGASCSALTGFVHVPATSRRRPRRSTNARTGSRRAARRARRGTKHERQGREQDLARTCEQPAIDDIAGPAASTGCASARQRRPTPARHGPAARLPHRPPRRHHVRDGDVHRHADPPLLDRLHGGRAAADGRGPPGPHRPTATCTAAAASAGSSCTCRCSASRCSTWSWPTTCSRSS